MKHAVFAVAACLGLATPGLVSAQDHLNLDVPLSAPMKNIVADLQGHLSSDQGFKIVTAIESSPELEAQLDNIASSGIFAGFRVGTAAQVATAGPFKAAVAQGYMVFTSEYLESLKINQPYDVQYPNEILPNNYVFVLGHLAYHLKNPGPNPHASSIEDYVKDRSKIEAGAFIQGWNDMIDAATRENSGRQLTAQQAGLLFMNLRYRFVFAPEAYKNQKIAYDSNSKILLNTSNISIISSRLANSNLADLM